MKLDLKKIAWLDVLTVLGPLTAYTLLTFMLSNWLIDDAGISFVYARNLAAGYGLVSQPGMPPIEGYSNPLWIFLMTPFFLIGLFEPFLTSKVISLIFVMLTFWVIHRIIQRLTGTKVMLSLVALLFIATNSSFIIWTASGLENPLFAFLVILLLYSIIDLDPAESNIRLNGLRIGLIVGGISLTRPDGLVYISVYPMFLIASTFLLTAGKFRSILKESALYSLGFLGTFGTYFIFRMLYFGDIFPNTYYVKGGPTLSIALSAVTLQAPYLTKFQILLQSIFGQFLWLLIPFIVILWILIVAIKDKQWLKYATILYMCGISCFTYLILINDWMGEFRLATAFFPLLFVLLAVACCQLYEQLKLKRKYKLIFLVITMVVLATSSSYSHYYRFTKFAHSAPTSFASIGERYGKRFNRYAEYLKLENASILLPDIGGTLYYSNLRIYDLAGLCDPTIAKTYINDPKAFYDYVFDEIKPTFIHTHGWFTATVKLDEDPRFERNYVAIKEYEDQYAEKRLKRKIMSGNYIRREAINGKEELFSELQAGLLN